MWFAATLRAAEPFVKAVMRYRAVCSALTPLGTSAWMSSSPVPATTWSAASPGSPSLSPVPSSNVRRASRATVAKPA